jgi:hypothetical protein
MIFVVSARLEPATVTVVPPSVVPLAGLRPSRVAGAEDGVGSGLGVGAVGDGVGVGGGVAGEVYRNLAAATLGDVPALVTTRM